MTIESKFDELISALGKISGSLEEIVSMGKYIPTESEPFTPYAEKKVVVAKETKKVTIPKVNTVVQAVVFVEPILMTETPVELEQYDRPSLTLAGVTTFAREKILEANDNGERKKLVQAEISKIGKADGGAGDKISSLTQDGLGKLEQFLSSLK